MYHNQQNAFRKNISLPFQKTIPCSDQLFKNHVRYCQFHITKKMGETRGRYFFHEGLSIRPLTS